MLHRMDWAQERQGPCRFVLLRVGAASSFCKLPPRWHRDLAHHTRKKAYFWQTCKISSVSGGKFVRNFGRVLFECAPSERLAKNIKAHGAAP